MNITTEKPKDIMNRFVWIDKYRVKLMNKEGIEKILDLKNNLKEVEYNIVPLFKNKEIVKEHAHYYVNRKMLTV